MRTHNSPLIFIVDNNLIYQKLIVQYINIANFTEILTFTNAVECLACIDLHPDIIITDLHYGEDRVNGIDLLMKTKILSPKTKVIFLSSYNDMEAAVNSVRLGAVDFIVKSKVALDKLIRRINQLVYYYREIEKVNSVSIKLAATIAVILVVFIGLILLYSH